METVDHIDRRFTLRNVLYGGLGFASLIVPAVSASLLLDGTKLMLARLLFIISPALGLSGFILNIRGLIRIREGLAGEYDLVLNWGGFFAAAFCCLAFLLGLLSYLQA